MEGTMLIFRYVVPVLISVVSMILYPCHATASGDELASIQNAIEMQDAGWTAADNWIMQLPSAERNRLCFSPDDVMPVLPVASGVHVEISHQSTRSNGSYFDWRDFQGFNWMSPVKNQASCGSCAAFASVGCLEAVVNIVMETPDSDIDLSEQHLFSCSGGNCLEGLYMGTAFDYIRDHGVPDEVCLPYTEVDDNCSETCSDWQERVTLIEAWNLLWEYEQHDQTLKEYVEESPVACYMEVYGDFYAYESGVYRHTSGSLRGGHFVVITGWDDALNCWICKNSWGTGWGMDGYFMIEYGNVQIGTWPMVPHYTATPPPPPCDQTGVEIQMPAHYFSYGSTCSCDAVVCNTDTSVLSDCMLFVILDVLGTCFFAPGFSAYDCYDMTFEPGETTVEVVPVFTWPGNTGSAQGIVWYGALTDAAVTHLIGESGSFEFGWGQP
jgi:C1A family cysteine protease